MFLTGEGALLAIGLAALVCGMLGTWAVLRWTAPKTAPRRAGKTATVPRAIAPANTSAKV